MATDDLDTRVLAALSELDALCSRLALRPRDLIEAFRESTEEALRPVPATVPENMVGLAEAAALLGIPVVELRRAVYDRAWTPKTPAPIYRRSPAGILWSRTQVCKAARARHEKQAARGLDAAIKGKPSREPKPKSTKTYVTPPPGTFPIAPPWEQDRGAAA